ncbi:MAG: PAS domain S-box protein [Nitriliruptoraceae bacterium]|nr:PAS domain S-box protein [Nitriliruptoraceae bacterium]
MDTPEPRAPRAPAAVPATRLDDPARLRSLRELALLDTDAEERFDRITRTVARLLEVPIAMLNLVDDERQWAKSAVGRPQGVAAERSISFCATVVAEDTALAVPDTLRDPRFATNPMVVDDEPGLRCYLGVPVHAPDGQPVGSLCVAGTEPRQLGATEHQILADLAGWVEAELARGQAAALGRRERDTAQRLEAVSAAVPDGVLVFDRGGIVVEANRAARRLLATQDTDLVGVDLTDALPFGPARDRLLALLRAEQLPETIIEVVDLTRFDGTSLPVELTVASTLDGGGYVAVARDVSDRRRQEEVLEALRRRHETILSVAADAILRIDRHGIVEFANPAAEQLLGVPHGTLLGQSLHERHHAHHADGSPYRWEQCPSFRTLRDGHAIHVTDEVYRRADGTPVEVAYTSTPVLDDRDVTGVVMIMRDISSQREVDRLKTAFLSTVSHELRTPLTAIKGSLGLLLADVVGPLATEQRELITVAHDSTDRLVRLVNDLLDLSRIEAGALRLHLADVAVEEVVGSAVRGVAGAADAAGIDLVRDLGEAGGAVVRLDADRVVQILTNLLGNAIRFAPTGSEVAVTGHVTDEHVVLGVHDQGAGVPLEARVRIFERFGQGDASDGRVRAGTGLGLPIARELAEAHGGTLTLVDRDATATGSTFELRLPRHPRAQEPT